MIRRRLLTLALAIGLFATAQAEALGKWLVYWNLWSKTCGIREARYSIDSDALDKVMPLPPCNLKEPHANPPSTYVSHASLPRKPGVAKVQILYADGTRSEVVTLPGEERD